MKKQSPHGIDITAPGGLTALMAFHRKTFGNAVMETSEEAAAKAAADAAAAKATADAAAAEEAKKADEKLGEGGIKALQSERARADAAEKRAAAAEAKIHEAERAKLSDIDRANKDRDDQATENAKLKAANARLAALAEHPVPEKYRHLVTGVDEATYLASAKEISDLAALAEGKAPKPDRVPGSGSRSGENNPAGGSVAIGRDLYASTHKKG